MNMLMKRSVQARCGCCRDYPPSARKVERRAAKRRERQAFKRDLRLNY